MKRSPLRSVNPQRRARLFARNFLSKEFVAFTQAQRCATCNTLPSQCSHAETRGMGGCGANWTRIFPQCRTCHYAYGEHRAEFFLSHDLSPEHIERFITEHRQAWERHAAKEIQS